MIAEAIFGIVRIIYAGVAEGEAPMYSGVVDI